MDEETIRAILVPLDGSAFAERALPVAAALARKLGASLHLVSVHDPASGFIDPATAAVASVELDQEIRSAQQEYLDQQAGAATAEGIPVVHELRTGEAAAELARYAEAGSIDLVVMTTHGRGGISRLWLGSVADRMVRRSARPLLLLRPDAGGTLDELLADVLVPLDGSVRAESVRGLVSALAGADGTLHLVNVVLPPFRFLPPPAPGIAYPESEPVQRSALYAYRYLRRLARPLREAGRKVATEAKVAADPAAEILAYAARHDVGLVAIATHGRGGLDRWMMGSVADKVVRSGTAAVLVVPTHENDHDELSGEYEAARREPDPAEAGKE
jgi:nucleotide-binding universal stress UspA family protein